MFDWNVVVSVRGRTRFKVVRRRLRTVARVDTTDHYNVLALKADDPELFLEVVKRDVAPNPGLGQWAGVGLVTNAQRERYPFGSPE